MEDGDDFFDTLHDEIIEFGFDAPSVDLLLEMASCGEYLSVAEILQDLINEEHSDWASEILKRIATRDGEENPDHATVAIILGTIIQTSGDAVAVKLVRKITAPKKQTGSYSYDFVAIILARMISLRQTQVAAQLFWALMQECGNANPHQDLVPKVLDAMVEADKTQAAAALCSQIIANDTSEECKAYYDVGWALARMTELGKGASAAAICNSMASAGKTSGSSSAGVQMESLMEGVASATDADTAASFTKALKEVQQGDAVGKAAAELEGLAVKE